MSILSKIFIVLLVVLSIATAVATVIIQRDTLSVRPQVAELSLRLDQVDAAKTDVERELTAKNKELEARFQDREKTIRDLSEAIKTRDGKVDDLTRSLADANKALESAKLDLTNWTTIATRAQSERAAAEAKAADYKTKLEDMTKTYTATNQRLAEVNAQRDFLLQQVRTLKEQIVLLNEQLNMRAAGVTAPTRTVSGDSSFSRTTGPTIKGKILKVDQGMATIDVGANDGVQQDMEFTVYRGSSYVGDLVITQVHAKMAVGRLARVQNAVQEQDVVSNNLASN